MELVIIYYLIGFLFSALIILGVFNVSQIVDPTTNFIEYTWLYGFMIPSTWFMILFLLWLSDDAGPR